MEEKEMNLIIKGAIQSTFGFFESFSAQSCESGFPFLRDSSNLILLDYTGIIGISGVRKGVIYNTMQRDMAKKLCEKFFEEDATDERMLLDLVGEVANTIAGNLRAFLGKDFYISTPVVLTFDDLSLVSVPLYIPMPVFFIPFTWLGYKFYVAVGIE